MFPVLVAADIFGTKLNYEVSFPGQPSIVELQQRVEHVFGNECEVRRPTSVPIGEGGFRIQRLQVFDERVEMWVDLLSSTQLTPMAQVYAFQPESAWHKEVQSKLPTAVKAPALPATAASPPPAPIEAAPVPAAAAPTPVVPPVVPAAIPATAPPDPSHEEKVRTVFDEIDGRRTGAAHLNDFLTLLRTLKLELPPGIAVHALFRKDPSIESLVTYPEFLVFAEKYPTLLDALFSRCREFWVGVRQKESLEVARQGLDAVKAAGADAKLRTIQATANTNAQEMKLQQAAVEMSALEAAEQEARGRVQAAQAEKDRLSSDVTARAGEVTRNAENIRAADLEHREAVRQVEHAEAMLRAQDVETVRVEEKLKELERALRETHGELDSMRALQAQRKADLNAVQAHQQNLLLKRQECERLAGILDDSLTAAEHAMGAAQDKERECETLLYAARDATTRGHAVLEADEKELALLREQEAATRVAEAEAARGVEAHQKMLTSLEQDCREHTLMIQRVQEEEQPLIDQELTLRAQREMLEAREAQLRNDHTSFQMRNGSRSLLAVAAAAYTSPTSFPYSMPADAAARVHSPLL